MEPPTYLAEKTQHPRDECITFDEVAQSQKEVQRQTSWNPARAKLFVIAFSATNVLTFYVAIKIKNNTNKRVEKPDLWLSGANTSDKTYKFN
jgi:murein endopeptidase